MKTIILPLFLLALNLCYARPVDSNIGGREAIFGYDEEEPLNTDYLMTTSTGYTVQKTGVMVGAGTDFSKDISSNHTRFHGLYHSIKLYDIYGELRHHWVPDPSNRFFDLITETYTTRENGVWTYGDLAE